MSKTAIVHDWLPVLGGAEHVVKHMIAASGATDMFTLFNFLSPQDQAYFGDITVHASRLNHLPMVDRYYRYLIMACAKAIEDFDLRGYDVVLSSSACFAKGVLTGVDQNHIAYIHSPPRYAWDLSHEYLEDASGWFGLKRKIAARAFHQLRLWDMRTIYGMDVVLSNSDFVARRIQKLYGRAAQTLYPPVDVAQFEHYLQPHQGEYYVTACRLVGYKRVDKVVQAFAQMPDKQLVVVGDGPELKTLQAMAGPNITFKGYLGRDEVAQTIAHARAFVYCALEDFGIVPVEAQAAGVPVIAFGKGGALETIKGQETPHPTGVFFGQQTPQAIQEAVAWFDANRTRFSKEACVAQAHLFEPTRFYTGLQAHLP
ncbi:MAG: glycosyltransferase [Pseudomonadota bacterium]